MSGFAPVQYFLPFDGNCIYNLGVEIAFDPEKNERNIRERGLSFELAAEFDFETSVTTEDTRRDYGETRFRSLGFIGAELHAVVFTVRGDAMRIISLRRANRRERARYEKNSES